MASNEQGKALNRPYGLSQMLKRPGRTTQSHLMVLCLADQAGVQAVTIWEVFQDGGARIYVVN